VPGFTSYAAFGAEPGDFLDEEGRHIEIADRTGDAVFRVGGFAFTQYQAFWRAGQNYLLNDAGKQPNEYDGFRLRKVHLDLGGYFDKKYGMTVGLESNKSTAVSLGFYHAYVYAKFDRAFELRMGKYTNPLSLEADQPSADALFTEPSLVDDLVPNKDLGIMAQGKLGQVAKYWLSVSNGEQDSESSSDKPGKPSQNGKMVTARVFFTPFKQWGSPYLKLLGLGIGGSWADQTNARENGSSTPGENVPWASLQTSLGSNVFLSYKSGVYAAGDFTHVDPHFYWFYGPVGVIGEFVRSSQVVAYSGRPSVRLDNTAWMVQGSYVFGGGAGYEGVVPRKDFDPAHGHWGALEVAARVHQLSADVKSFGTGQTYSPTFSTALATGPQIATAYGVGVNWWFNDHFKWMFDVERTEFTGGNLVLKPEQVFIARTVLIL
jgi:phosphate-selective porin OprO/OprP